MKDGLYQKCIKLLEDRILHAERAMLDAQESANAEDKSSAGDKYETSRAMSQLDRDMNARQLVEARQALGQLLQLKNTSTGGKITTGSLVETTQGFYYIAAGIGLLQHENQQVAVISPQSPLAKLMLGKQSGDVFIQNGKTIRIRSIR